MDMELSGVADRRSVSVGLYSGMVIIHNEAAASQMGVVA
jgi:hypothetical protein